MRNGYDVFFKSPGECNSVVCYVCGTKCNVERNKSGATCFAQAVSGNKSRHDYFYCPYSTMEWHQELSKLVIEYENTTSKRVRALIMEDIEDIKREYLSEF